MTGARLIRRTLSQGNFFLSLPYAMIDHAPKIQYRIEKQNAFDPTYIHRREPYHLDTITLKTPISPTDYRTLYAFLIADGTQYYIEFETDSVLRQFPLFFTQLPACPDDLHEYPAEITLTMESRYTDPLSIINFDIVALGAFHESFTTT